MGPVENVAFLTILRFFICSNLGITNHKVLASFQTSRKYAQQIPMIMLNWVFQLCKLILYTNNHREHDMMCIIIS